MLPLGDMDHYDAWLVAVSYSGIITSYCLTLDNVSAYLEEITVLLL